MAMEDKVTLCPKCKDGVWLYPPNSEPTKKICPTCGSELISPGITAEENFLIRHISDEWDFILAMIDLKNNNIIEHQTKIAQFREQAKRDGCYDKPKKKCPKCGSTEFTPVRKKFSFLTGFATNKTELICNRCGAKVE